jgi:hypothetical protein
MIGVMSLIGPSRHSRLVCETVAIGEQQTLIRSSAYDPVADIGAKFTMMRNTAHIRQCNNINCGMVRLAPSRGNLIFGFWQSAARNALR